MLEQRQVTAYLASMALGLVVGFTVPHASALNAAINPALALMLFVTFLQVPLAKLQAALRNTRFLRALLVANFVAVPATTAILIQFLPDDPMLRLAVLLVLLTPCVDYVVTFAHLGHSDAQLLLVATPVLLLLQMVLLPVYLGLLLGNDVSGFVEPEPFIHAFLWLIALPLAAAAITQAWASRTVSGQRTAVILGALPVLATALVLFLVVAAVAPRIGDASGAALSAVPIYVAYAAIAPVIGWMVARWLHLDAGAARAVAFSAATRNSLVVLPLALAVPGGVPIVPAVIVTQTMVELVASALVYVRWIPRFVNGPPG